MSDADKCTLKDEVAALVLSFFKEKVDSTVQMTKEEAVTWVGHPKGTGGKGIFGRLYFADDFAAYYGRDGKSVAVSFADPGFWNKVKEWIAKEYKVKLQ